MCRLGSREEVGFAIAGPTDGTEGGNAGRSCLHSICRYVIPPSAGLLMHDMLPLFHLLTHDSRLDGGWENLDRPGKSGMPITPSYCGRPRICRVHYEVYRGDPASEPAVLLSIAVKLMCRFRNTLSLEV